ncbi:unnamed protein product [Paramecium pentaurelia]|uniref:Palmitoyltransferase n=1 Tax=Paramecium pentaurelia TaxID=43138 RepID=A0A8S1W912_9CILI|nr:unnamed protein product [Paramecium pentaurelia]
MNSKYQNSGCKLKEDGPSDGLYNQSKQSADFNGNLEFSKNKSNSVVSSLNGMSEHINDVTPPFGNKVDLKGFQAADLELFPFEPKSEKNNFRFLYEFWPSFNQIFCYGRLMTGPKGDRYHNMFTWIMIIGISTCFFVIVAPYVWQKLHWLYVLIVIYLFLSTILFLVLTQFSDPGIIPRKTILELSDQNTQFINKEEAKIEGTGGCPDKRKKKYQNQEQRVCSTCLIVKPLRCSHCKDCGNCVQVFDHHCPFVNNCIGQRNYRFFIAFLISLLLLAIGELGGFLILFIGNFGEGISGKDGILIQNQTILVIVLFALGIPTILLTLCILVFVCFHICLAYNGKTTKEQLQKKKITSKGTIPSTVWCDKAKSLFNLRQKIHISKLQKFQIVA